MQVYLDRPKSKNWFDFYSISQSIREKTVTLERILLDGIPLPYYLDCCRATNWHYGGLFGLGQSF